MVEYGRGAKAGFLAGIVWGIIAGVVVAVLFTIFKDSVIASIQTVPGVTSPADMYNTLLAFAVGTIFVVGMFLGTILGAFFSLVYGLYLKSTDLRIRGMVFGVILWLIGMALNENGGMGSGIEYFGIFVLGYLFASLVYGYLLGYFFERFDSAKKVTYVEETKSWRPPSSPPTAKGPSKIPP